MVGGWGRWMVAFVGFLAGRVFGCLGVWVVEGVLLVGWLGGCLVGWLVGWLVGGGVRCVRWLEDGDGGWSRRSACVCPSARLLGFWLGGCLVVWISGLLG